MFISKVRPDGVFDGLVEVPNETKAIPSGHSFSLPGEIPADHYAIMLNGWKIVPGIKPIWPPAVVPPTREHQIDALEQKSFEQLEINLDLFAQQKGYTNIISACSYVNSNVESFKKEALTCIALRDQSWQELLTFFDRLRKSTSEVPESFSDIESLLPKLVWN